jgi:hypothetical protein
VRHEENGRARFLGEPDERPKHMAHLVVRVRVATGGESAHDGVNDYKIHGERAHEAFDLGEVLGEVDRVDFRSVAPPAVPARGRALDAADEVHPVHVCGRRHQPRLYGALEIVLVANEEDIPSWGIARALRGEERTRGPRSPAAHACRDRHGERGLPALRRTREKRQHAARQVAFPEPLEGLLLELARLQDNELALGSFAPLEFGKACREFGLARMVALGPRSLEFVKSRSILGGPPEVLRVALDLFGPHRGFEFRECNRGGEESFAAGDSALPDG